MESRWRFPEILIWVVAVFVISDHLSLASEMPRVVDRSIDVTLR